MNWQLLINSILAFGLFFVIMLTLALFIAYKRDRKLSKKKHTLDPSKGRYFTRFIPPALEDKYKVGAAGEAYEKELQREKRKYQILFALPFVVFAITLTYFIVAHRHKFRALTQLTPQEVETLNNNEHNWTEVISSERPNWAEVRKAAGGMTLAFIYSTEDLRWRSPVFGHYTTQLILNEWKKWAAQNGFKTIDCDWKTLKTCAKSISNTLFVAPTGSWQTDGIDSLLSQGANVFLLGAPIQLLNGDQGQIDWKTLQFRRVDRKDGWVLGLRGEQKLTLGWEAGSLLSLLAVEPNYQVLTESPDAYRLTALAEFPAQAEAGIASGIQGKGRWIWADFLPNRENNPTLARPEDLDDIVATFFRFYLRQEYQATATWPEGRTFAGFAAGNLEDRFEQAEDLLSAGIENLSWFAVSTMAEERFDLSKKLAAMGPMNCQCDVHVNLDKDGLKPQVQRLFLCSKALSLFGKLPNLGLRPPEEKFNTHTYSAAVNTGYDFVFLGRGSKMVPSIQRTDGLGPRLVILNRMSLDDHFLFVINNLGPDDALRNVEQDIKWMERMGGMYSYTFHSQHLNRPGHVDLIKSAVSRIKDSGAFFANANEMARWWAFRQAFIDRKGKISNAIKERWPISRVKMTSDGNLIKEKVTD